MNEDRIPTPFTTSGRPRRTRNARRIQAITPSKLLEDEDIQDAVASAAVLAVIELSNVPELDISFTALYKAVKRQIAFIQGIELEDDSQSDSDSGPDDIHSPDLARPSSETMKCYFDELSEYLVDHPIGSGKHHKICSCAYQRLSANI